MYFWNIYKLKKELALLGLKKHKVGFYLFAIVFIQIVPDLFINDVSSFWNNVETAIFFLLLITGTIYCYQVNGASNRKGFSEIYISLAWVFGIRYGCMIMIPVLCIFYMILTIVSPNFPEGTHWYDVALIAALRIIFYYFLGEHIRNVSQNNIVEGSKLLNWLRSRFPRDHLEAFDPSQYPSIVTRYLATTVDGVFIISLFIGASYLFQGNEVISISIRLDVIFLMLFIYEPFFTSKFCTLGQMVMKIRVKSIQTQENITLLTAYIRILIKLVLGIISFFSIPFTKNKRGLHDLAAGSVVIYADRAY